MSPVERVAARSGYPRLGGTKLSDRVAEELQARILRGDAAPGERLPTEADLGELFGVSRSVIRDALRTLAARGLVRMGAGQGIVVTDPSDEALGEALVLLLARSGLTMGEVTDARASLEIQVGPLAATRGTSHDWESMEETLERFGRAIETMDWRDAHTHHLAFHLALLHALHSPALEILLRPMHQLTLLSSVPPEDTPELWDVMAHRPVLEALRKRDAVAVGRTLDQHYQRFLRDARYEGFEATPFGEAGLEAIHRLRNDAGSDGA
jgi:DNA-binding FadR family transcriptional regulator